MAEVTGLRNNALPYPVYAAPWAVVFPIRDSSGDLVTGATGLDSEVSLNGDTFTDCTNEAMEIGSTGMYYLLLTAAECTADVVAGLVKTSTVNAKTTTFSLYPRKLPQIRANTAQGGAAGYITLDAAASAVDDRYNGTICIATIDGNVEARVISDYNATTKQASVIPNWNVAPDSDDTFIIRIPDGIQRPAVDVIAISGDVTAADNLEAAYDGTGYAGGTIKQGVDVVAISGDSTAADTLEAILDVSTTTAIAVTTDVNVTAINGSTDAAGYLYAALDAGFINANVIQWDYSTTDVDRIKTMDAYVWGTDLSNPNYDTTYASGILKFIQARVVNLSPGSISVQSPVIGAQTISFIKGDSYTETADFDRSVRLTVTTPLNLAHTNANVYGYFDVGSTSLLVVQPVVTNTDTNVYDLQFEFTNEQTVNWAASGAFDIKCWWDTETTEGDVTTIITGTFTVSTPTYDGAEGADAV